MAARRREREGVIGGLTEHSAAASDLAKRVLLPCANAPPPSDAPDEVHADLNPSNVLVRDGVVVGIVDIDNAGSGTRATDLVTLLWHTFHGSLDDVRSQLWAKVLGIVGWDWAAVLSATHILLQLRWRIGLEDLDAVTHVISRGHSMFDELETRR